MAISVYGDKIECLQKCPKKNPNVRTILGLLRQNASSRNPVAPSNFQKLHASLSHVKGIYHFAGIPQALENLENHKISSMRGKIMELEKN